MARKFTLAEQVVQNHISELFAYQYCDQSGEYTIRKSFEQLIDQDTELQNDIVDMFRIEGGYRGVAYADKNPKRRAKMLAIIERLEKLKKEQQ